MALREDEVIVLIVGVNRSRVRSRKSAVPPFDAFCPSTN
jgi:hypothetical protein